MEDTVVLLLIETVQRLHVLLRLRAHVGADKTLPHILHRLRRRVHHILRIETVITQLIQHYLVGREVLNAPMGGASPPLPTKGGGKIPF